jgi:hypothetical protein
MAYLIIILAFGLVGFNIWLAERREDRWQKRMSDLLNRKMAHDFYDYVQGSADLERASKMTTEQLRFAEILATEKAIKEGNEKSKEPPFINQYRSHVEAKT